MAMKVADLENPQSGDLENPPMPPIFVISLARAVDRRAAICRRLDSLGLVYEIVDGVDGKTLDKREIAEDLDREYWRVLRGRFLSDGEIGCYLSHYFLWDRIFEAGLETAIILEDDAVLGPNSSRFWPAKEWTAGKNPASFDKQILRDWLETTSWNKQPSPPKIPETIAQKTTAKYREIRDLLLGGEF